MATSQEIKKNIEKRIAERARDIAVDIWEGLVEATPKQTGRAASSWRVNRNETDTSVTPEGDNTVVQGVTKLDTVKGREADKYFISNHIPYIGVLNKGSSTQAPRNFVMREIIKNI